MCEKRIRKIKKGSQVARLREARRLHRLQWVPAPITVTQQPTEEVAPPPQQSAVNKAAHNRVILGIAWKTVALMQKNRLIQQKIIALQKETSEFIADVMRNPERRQRYLEHLRLHAAGLITLEPMKGARNTPIKVEPKD